MLLGMTIGRYSLLASPGVLRRSDHYASAGLSWKRSFCWSAWAYSDQYVPASLGKLVRKSTMTCLWLKAALNRESCGWCSAIFMLNVLGNKASQEEKSPAGCLWSSALQRRCQSRQTRHSTGNAIPSRLSGISFLRVLDDFWWAYLSETALRIVG
mgnify:CR=1 FL=1